MKRIIKIAGQILLYLSIFNNTNSQTSGWEKTQKKNRNIIADSLNKNLKKWKVPNKIFKVEDFGAKGDTTTNNTIAIQNTINACSNYGGGRVLFSKGAYMTGTIILRSNVMIEVLKDAKIIGSVHLNDYPEKREAFKSVNSEIHKYRLSLIYAEACTNVGISGKGEIYFRGEKSNFPGDETTSDIVGRPFGIRMIDCKNIVVEDIYLHNSAAWMQSYLKCENLIFDSVKVLNQANYNNDGLDIDGCKNVVVKNCFINSEDDAMCLKGSSGIANYNILIQNSVFITSCNALKIGTDTRSNFYNIIARNLKIGGIPDSLYVIKSHEASTGITLATVDGGNVDKILISNVEINRTRCPIFLRIGNRMRVLPNTLTPNVGELKNIIIQNITGNNNFIQGSLITGINGHPIQNITINNYKINFIGGGDSTLLNRTVPDKENGYPDAQSFLKDGLPANGFYIRNANNISFNKAQVIASKPDKRPFLIKGEGTININY